MTRRFLAMVVLLAYILCGCASGSTDTEASSTMFAMDTVIDLTAYGTDANEAIDAAKSVINELNLSLSTTDPQSEIYALNSNAGEAFTLSATTYDLIKKALSLCEKTGGALDISIYPIVKAWGFTTKTYSIPTEAELKSLLERVGYKRVVLNDSTRSICLDTGMEIDLGAVAKGYASDLAVKAIADTGVQSALINLGGNVHALGVKPNGEMWNVAIQDPLIDSKYLCVFPVSDEAVVTSGGYERYFTGDAGEVYWHIIDPSTGCPAMSGLISVTIISNSGLYSDALSTALFIMGLDAAINFWREHGDFEAVFVTDDYEIFVTPGLSESITLPSDSEYTLYEIE